MSCRCNEYGQCDECAELEYHLQGEQEEEQRRQQEEAQHTEGATK